VDLMAEKRPELNPYNYVENNPLNRIDPDGALDYPIITITKQKVGTGDQRVIGQSDVIKADLYKAVVTDTEDTNFRMEFSVTRDAWEDVDGDGVARNTGFEPKDGKINHYTANKMRNGFPEGNGTEALKLTQYGSEEVHADPNQTAVDIGSRDKLSTAKGIMIHVGGNYEKGGKNSVAASLGCFGVFNPKNSATNQSNNYTNDVMNAIQKQAANSTANPGKIEVIIQKRTGNEYPNKKNY
jgi:hypothetical protein